MRGIEREGEKECNLQYKRGSLVITVTFKDFNVQFFYYFHIFTVVVNFLSIQPVCHYTLASIYLSLHDYVASTIHLRTALHAQPSFDHALSALKLVRCSMKFKEEKAQLRKKVELIIIICCCTLPSIVSLKGQYAFRTKDSGLHPIFISVLPRQNLRHDNRAQLGWRLWPHQSLWISTIPTS